MRRSLAPEAVSRAAQPATKEAGIVKVAEQKTGSGETYILKTTKSAAEIRSTLEQKCQHNCQLRQIGTDSFKLDVMPRPSSDAGPRAAAPSPASLPDKAEIERMFGGDVKVYDNRLSRPSK
jgi:hypothetical protein